jgi:hypothetical protein
MDARIFQSAPMGLRNILLRLRISERFSYDAEKNMFFINFEGHEVATLDDVEAIRREVEAKLSGLKVRPHAIVNYDNFSIRPDMLDAYSEMVVMKGSRDTRLPASCGSSLAMRSRSAAWPRISMKVLRKHVRPARGEGLDNTV